MWPSCLKLKSPPKTLYVCSFHFVDKMPTALNPYPTLWLGYEYKPPKKRRLLERSVVVDTVTGNLNVTAVNIDKLS